MKLHAIAGLPRSGSTLLCDILNQNPRFHAGSTSSIPGAIQGLRSYWSTSAEIISDLADDKDKAEARMKRGLSGLLAAWYADTEAEVIFDKGRGWIALQEVLSSMQGKVICCVRDPRNVLASVEKRRADNPILSIGGAGEQTQLERVHALLARDGMVGGPIAHIEDLVRRGAGNVVAVPFERLVAEPELTMRSLYKDLCEPYFEHNFDEVDSTATDLDAAYLYKFPHKRETAPVKDPGTSWADHVPQSIADEVIKSFPTFCQTFGYA